MNKLISINVEMFHTVVTVTFDKETFLEVAGEWGSDQDEFEMEVSGLCLNDPENGILVGVFLDGIPTLVHELTHASVFMLNRVGIDPRDSSGEVLAYLLEYLLKKSTEKVAGKTKQSRKTKRNK